MSDVGVTSDVIPKKARKSYKEPDPEEFDEEDAKPDTTGGGDEEEEGEDLDEDEFIVEKIFSHYIAEDVCCPLCPAFPYDS